MSLRGATLRSAVVVSLLAACAGAPAKQAEPARPLIVTPVATPKTTAPVTASAEPSLAPWEKIVRKLPSLPKHEIDATFAELRALADPRAAGALVEYLASNPHARAKTLAAFALAESADARAVPVLAWRLGEDPLLLYPADDESQWARDDNERVTAARLLADLIQIHPEKRVDIARAAEDAVLAWAESRPEPHANAMRFLARTGSSRAFAKLSAWADPKEPLPKRGEQAFPPSVATAQAALRYVGLARRGSADEKTRALLLKQLRRRPATLDTSMDALMNGGIAVLGMTLRAYAYGAAQGFAEIGDSKDVPLLIAFVDEKKNNEQARTEASIAIGLSATPEQLVGFARKIKSLDAGIDIKMHVDLAVRMEAFLHDIAVDLSSVLGPLVAKGGHPQIQDWANRVLVFEGRANVDVMLDPSSLAGHFTSFPEREYEQGHFARLLRTFSASETLWPDVKRALTRIDLDAGPGTLTRVVARARLLRDARGADAKKRDDARFILQAMGEQASLDALAEK